MLFGRGSWGRAAALLLFVLVVAGCKTLVPYTPKPESVDNPTEELEVALNNATYPPALLEVKEKFLKATWPYPNGGALTRSVRYADVATVNIYSQRGHHDIQVLDATGEELFFYETKRVQDAERFADALMAAKARALAK